MFKVLLVCFTSLFFGLLAPSFSYASFSNDDPDDGDNYDDLFDYGYGYSAQEVIEYYYVGTGTYEGLTCDAAIAQAWNTFKDSKPNSIQDGIKIVEYTNFTLKNISPCVAYADYTRKRRWSNGTIRDSIDYTDAVVLSASYYSEQAHECPPDNWPNAIVEANLGEALFCFTQADLNTRDSCPDSTQDDSYILPVDSNNTASKICQIKPDGSSCEYDLDSSGNFYVSNFENTCYENNGITQYDDSGLGDVDDTNVECQDIGAQTYLCPEDPSNVCDSQGTCESGCGYFGLDDESQFVCVSGDNDSDGVPDYLDPDIDGDGIKNEDDLDSDGDGVDDVKYPENNDVTVNIDMSNIESKLDTILDEMQINPSDYNGKTASDLQAQESIIDDAISSLTDTAGLSQNDMGGRAVTSEDFTYIDTFIGQLPSSSCVNPVIYNQTLDFCSKAPIINQWLYWICAALTTIAVFTEMNNALRRK